MPVNKYFRKCIPKKEKDKPKNRRKIK